MKPILLCDVDDVLVDLSGSWLDVLHDFTGRRHVLSEVKTFKFPIASEAEAKVVWAHFNRRNDNNVYDLPLYQGARDFLKEARSLCRVVACTSPDSPEWAKQRYQALVDKMGFEKQDIVLCKDKALIHGDFLLDDAPHNVPVWESFDSSGRRFGILWNRPWNATLEHHSRASTYNEALDYLR